MKKIVTVIWALALSVFCAAGVFAEEAPLEKLTVEKAFQMAMSASSDVLKSSEDLELNQLKLEEARQDYKSEADPSARLRMSIQIMQMEASGKLSYETLENQKTSMEYSITQVFADIIAAQNELELYDKNLTLEKEKLKIAKVKIGLGLLSENDYDALSNAYNKLVKERGSKKISISNAYDSLNKVLGKNLDTRYELVLDLKYGQIGDRDVQSFVSNAVDTNTSLKQKADDVKSAEYELQTYGSYAALEEIEPESSKLSYELKVTQAVRTYNTAVEQLSQKVRTAYNEIAVLETQIESSRTELEELKKQRKVNEAKFEVGRLTKLDMDSHEYKILQLEESIRVQEYRHELKVTQIKNSNLL